MGRRESHIASFVLLTVLASTWAQSGPDGATGEPETQTAARIRAARRAGSTPIGKTPSGQTGPSKLDRLLEKLRGSRVRKKEDPNDGKGKTTTPPDNQSPKGGGKSPTTRPVERAATQPAGAPADAAAADKAEEEALARLKALPDGAFANPRAQADYLFLAGKTRGAIIFYERALKAASADDRAGRAWILYQLGNVHSASNPDLAVGFYRQVQAEHGDSDWCDPAKVQADLIKWKQDNKPAELIKSITADSKTL